MGKIADLKNLVESEPSYKIEYINKEDADEIINDVKAFNNIMVKKQEGQSMVVYYISGTSFAKDGVEKMLKEKDIPYTKNSSGTIQIAHQK